MCTITHTDAFLELPTEDFERLGKEIKRLEGLVEGRDAEIERLNRGWNASIAELHAARDMGDALRAALRQILEDPDVRILDSHRDDGWEALSQS